MVNENRFNRRGFLAMTAGYLAVPASFCIGSGEKLEKLERIGEAAKNVKPRVRWTADHLYEFLNSVPDDGMLSLKKGLGMVDKNATLSVLNGKSKDVREIQKRALWISNNLIAYPFKDETTLNYHELVSWVASYSGIKEETIRNASTFTLEREIQKQSFAELWDKMSESQRKIILGKIDPDGHIADKAKIAALGGAAAVAALSTSVAFFGFAFYSTMSMMISTVAGFLGVTLPFAAYTGASSLVAFLSGPVGLAIVLLAAFGGVALAGRADPKQTAAFVFQIHALKVAALIAAEVPEKDIFS